MGWWTLGGDRRAPIIDRVAAEFSYGVLRIEQRGDTFHALAKAEDGRIGWAVALVENGMVKTMDETAGPYCARCSPEFYAAALEACGTPEPGTFASQFRERMAGTRAA